jgi:orotate phosphoribosyltransferase
MMAIFSYGFDVATENFEKAGVTLNTLSDYEHLLENAEKSSYITASDKVLLSSWRENPSEWNG